VASLAEQAIDAINAVFGRHSGCRAVHTKGIVCRGAFTATPAAAAITTAAHMQGEPVPVTVRFSNFPGSPDSDDRTRDVRGMATKFYLRSGARTDLLAITTPCFIVRRPEDFVAFTRAVAHPVHLPWFIATHPESWRGLWESARAPRVASYGTARYHAVHAFAWVGPKRKRRHVRCSWIPEAGEQSLDREAMKQAGRDFLQREIVTRMSRGPVRFTLQLQFAGEDDPIDDPTTIWHGREVVEAGTLELTGLDDERERGDDVLVFDPTRLTPGIERVNDEILLFRPKAYSVSVGRRI
jgi:catalase